MRCQRAFTRSLLVSVAHRNGLRHACGRPLRVAHIGQRYRPQLRRASRGGAPRSALQAAHQQQDDQNDDNAGRRSRWGSSPTRCYRAKSAARRPGARIRMMRRIVPIDMLLFLMAENALANHRYPNSGWAHAPHGVSDPCHASTMHCHLRAAYRPGSRSQCRTVPTAACMSCRDNDHSKVRLSPSAK